MDMLDVLTKKRYGEALLKDEIDFFIRGVTEKTIPDYQISAFLMAVALNGMNKEEMTDLTLAMAYSGEICDLSSIPGKVVDKHSTGGVGDKCTPILLCIMRACGVPVAKLSGRGLGFTGGTIDKLESIRDFQTSVSLKDFAGQVKKCGIVLSGQTPLLAPADKVLYALRDVTATVESIPLIASSIMSKKIAGGAEAIVLDITYGSGAFMKSLNRARELADAMLDIGRIANRAVTCVLTPMEQPLGYGIGNVIELDEVWETLQGKGPEDLNDVCVALAASMLRLSDIGNTMSFSDWEKKVREILKTGSAAEAYTQFIQAQGGRTGEDGKPVYVSKSQEVFCVTAEKSGWISRMDALSFGESSMLLGAGRRTKEDTIDAGAGLLLLKKIGDKVEAGEPVVQLYSGDPSRLSGASLEAAVQKITTAVEYSIKPVQKEELDPEILSTGK